MAQLPESVDGVEWRIGRADDVAVLTAVMAAADAVDVPLHIQTESDTEDLLRTLVPEEAVVVGTQAGVALAASVLWRPGDGPVRLRGGVVPEARGRGIGRLLLRYQLERAAALHPDATLASLRTTDGRGPTGLVERLGFDPARAFLTMRRSLLGGVEALPLAADLHVVPFGEDLDEPLRIAKNDVFQDHWQGLADTPEQWRTRMLGPRLDRALSRIALDEHGDIAGFVLVQRIPEHPEQAYIPLLGTLRAHRGKGVARCLLTDALAAAAEKGFLETELGVDADSPTNAVQVYEAVGYESIERATVWQHPL